MYPKPVLVRKNCDGQYYFVYCVDGGGKDEYDHLNQSHHRSQDAEICRFINILDVVSLKLHGE